MIFYRVIAGWCLSTTLLMQASYAQKKPVEPAKSKRFVLSGKYKGPAPGFIYLSYMNGKQQRVTDSAAVKNGAFTFKGSIDEPVMAVLLHDLKGFDDNAAQLFLEPATMQVKVDGSNFSKAVLTGSATQKELDQLQKAQEPIQKEMEPLSAQYDAAHKALDEARKNNATETVLDSLKYRAAAIHEQFSPYFGRMKACSLRFFEKHPASPVTAYYLRLYIGDLPLDSLKLFYSRLGATQQTSYGKYLAAEIAKLEGGSPGSMAKNFNANDINGKLLSLANFKGKYVLVDFWASWCVPCRKGNPHLKELYALYKDKGLEIIGVASDDSDPGAWRKAVEKDGLPWRQVLSGLKLDAGKGYDTSNDIGALYGIRYLPTQILIDPAGNIIGRYDEGAASIAALDKKLAEIFK